jgi:hypothetical protein
MNAIKEVKKEEKSVNNVKLLPIPKQDKPATVEQKEEVLKMIEKFKPEPILTAEARIERMKQFEALSTRFGALKDKSNELKTYKAGNDKINAKITFQNAQGFKMEVQNSNVIQKLVEAAENELNILLSEAENEVLTFEI